MSQIQAFILRHRKTILVAFLVLATAAGGFTFGRYGTAERVVVQDRVVEKVVEKEVVKYVDRVVEKIVHDKAAARAVRVVKVEVTKPDGTVTKTETTEDKTVIDEHAATDKTEMVTLDKSTVKYVDRVVEHKVEITKPMPDWRIHVLAGVSTLRIPGLVTGTPLDVLQDIPMGVQVERRIVGPISAGAWGLSTGQVGLSLSLEF